MGKRKAKGDNTKMSRQPPLPRGPPPRSSGAPGTYEGDSYRPREDMASRYNAQPPPAYYNNAPPPASSGMFQFKGAASTTGGSNYRPGYDNYDDRSYTRPRSPARQYEYRDAYPRPPSPRGNSNSYRPSYDDRAAYDDRVARNERSRDFNQDFSFRVEAPSGLDHSRADAPIPRNEGQRRGGTQGMNRSNQNNMRKEFPRGGARGGRGYLGRGGPRMASEREFLKTNRDKTPELMLGMAEEDDSHNAKYKAVDDMSDSDEAEMDVSNSDDDASAAQNTSKLEGPLPKKRIITGSGDDKPRWSNPDPYSALPPPDPSDRKKKDVVKLIRKARVQATYENVAKTDAPDDFISLDFGDDDVFDKPPSGGGAPSGPRHDFQHERRDEHDYNIPQTLESRAPPATAMHQLPPRPEFQAPAVPASVYPKSSGNQSTYVDLTTTPNLSLGDRKRTHDDYLRPPPQIHGSPKGKKPPSNGQIQKSWKAKAGQVATPWISRDHSAAALMGVWLHLEIMDFYQFVKPRDFEDVVRQRLIDDLQDRVKDFNPNARIRAFGSFPAGLYLPTADMDLVCVSDQYMSGGYPLFTGNNTLYRFEQFLRRQGLAQNNTIEVIRGAKVPLVKYVCALTGLKVDISFENNTGLIANDTFQKWKREFPAMPILVTLIKHLLAMRGLNEPVNGGIGGFSTICLVVSVLQLMPEIQSGSMTAEHNLGEVLMHFLLLYGKQFDTVTNAIVLHPPMYLPKTHSGVQHKGIADKFMIIDPNRPDNDISGGSANTKTIRKCFAESYDALQKRMGDLNSHRAGGPHSILETVIAGNYTSFQLQREHLAHVHEQLYGPVNRT